jgi:hypothetical protein
MEVVDFAKNSLCCFFAALQMQPSPVTEMQKIDVPNIPR